MNRIRVNLFGKHASVLVGGKELAFDRRMPWQLLAVLAFAGDKPTERTRLVALVTRREDKHPFNALSAQLTRLRALLGEQALRDSGPYGLVLNPEVVTVDLWEFRADLMACMEGVWSESTNLRLRQVLARYQPLLSDDRWQWLAAARQDVLETCIRACRRLRFAEALTFLSRADGLHPALSEVIVLHQMQAMSDIGDYTGATEAYAMFSRRHGRSQAADALARVISGREVRLAEADFWTAPDGTHPIRERERDLVGRDTTIREAAWRLANDRMVTITGPPGVGKTQLALSAAHRVQENYAQPDSSPSFPTGARVVDFITVTAEDTKRPDPARLARHIKNALGMRDQPGEANTDPIGALCATLGDRPLLLVLDNLEHVALECSLLVVSLLGCEGVRLILTTRIPLPRAVRGATLPVSPLTVPEPGDYRMLDSFRTFLSVQLFEHRATRAIQRRDRGEGVGMVAIEPDSGSAPVEFRVTVENALLVEELCRDSGGIPLAIEIMAGQLYLRPRVDEVVAQWRSQGLGVRAAEKPRDLRHTTLRQTIDWSYRLLSKEGTALFRRLAVFVGGCSADAAREVCGFDDIAADDVSYWLDELAGASLLDVSGRAEGKRYRMLVPVQEFAQTLLSGTEREATLAKFAAYFATFAADAHLQIPLGGDRFRDYDAEYDNLIGAIDAGLAVGAVAQVLHAASLMWQYWRERGRLREGYDYLIRILDVAGNASPSYDLGTACFGAGDMAQHLGDLPQARRLYGRSYSVYVGAKSRLGVAGVLEVSALLHRDQGRLGLARRLLLRALKVRREEVKEHPRRGDLVAQTLNNLAMYDIDIGDFAAAIPRLEEALTILTTRKLKGPYGPVLDNWGLVLYAVGDFSGAQAKWLESLAIHRAENAFRHQVLALANLGLVSTALGAYDEAAAYLLESLSMNAEIGDVQRGAWARHYLGALALRQGRYEDARRAFTESLPAYLSLQHKGDIASALDDVAALATRERSFGMAAQLLGATMSAREKLKLVLWPVAAEPLRQHIAELTSQLGAEVLDRERQIGASLTLEEAGQLALDYLTA
ncbi:MAG TPA: tetratricopeptide repeat protein [Armatimonadota bacterium]|jgi:predicted ATPase